MNFRDSGNSKENMPEAIASGAVRGMAQSTNNNDEAVGYLIARVKHCFFLT